MRPTPGVAARVHTRVLLGLEAHPVAVECHIAPALPSTTIVGLPDGAVREAKDRVRAAIRSAGFEYPEGRVVINLAPGDLAKRGSYLDLAIALSVLAASGQVEHGRLADFEFIGELGLYGDLRPGHGALSCALACAQSGRRLVAPSNSGSEIHLARPGTALLAPGLLAAARLLNGTETLADASRRGITPPAKRQPFAGVVGQEAAKRALTIAAAGGHHALMIGPPGVGKTLLARGFADLLPDLDTPTATEVAAIHAAAGLQRDQHLRPPMRDPHHSASAAAMVGGGRSALPGEISLAHSGVLFMDELPHFKPAALNLLREPLENGEIMITRASYRVTYPCRLRLLAAMNPCPAGRTCREAACRCSPAEVMRYQKRISGPLLDRIDLHIGVPEVPLDAILEPEHETDPGGDLQALVERARDVQQLRQAGLNADLKSTEISRHIAAANDARQRFKSAMAALELSARSLHKIWKVARTVADLAGAAVIQPPHLAEAMGFRRLNWEQGVSFTPSARTY